MAFFPSANPLTPGLAARVHAEFCTQVHQTVSLFVRVRDGDLRGHAAWTHIAAMTLVHSAARARSAVITLVLSATWTHYAAMTREHSAGWAISASWTLDVAMTPVHSAAGARSAIVPLVHSGAWARHLGKVLVHSAFWAPVPADSGGGLDTLALLGSLEQFMHVALVRVLLGGPRRHVSGTSIHACTGQKHRRIRSAASAAPPVVAAQRPASEVRIAADAGEAPPRGCR